MYLLTSLVVTIAAFAALWAIHLSMKNAGVVDFYWGPGFVVIGIIYMLTTGVLSTLQLVFLSLVAIWAIRLSFYLSARFARHRVEDARYAVMRQNGGLGFWWTSLFKIFVLQAVIMWIIASPIHTALLLEQTQNTISGLALIGFLLFWSGFAIETIADCQLTKFKRKSPQNHALLTTGLWSWCRHPNYFGEALLWWGLGIMAFAVSGSLWSFAGPAVLTMVLVAVSGLLTDRHMAESRGGIFADYAGNTSAFLPLPPALYSRIKLSTIKKDRPAV